MRGRRGEERGEKGGSTLEERLVKILMARTGCNWMKLERTGHNWQELKSRTVPFTVTSKNKGSSESENMMSKRRAGDEREMNRTEQN
jgi:hypothetical protein